MYAEILIFLNRYIAPLTSDLFKTLLGYVTAHDHAPSPHTHTVPSLTDKSALADHRLS